MSMIHTFRLIAEGKTDLYVIENILVGLLGEDNIDVIDLSPLRNAKAGESFSNWEKVLEYCTQAEFAQAFQTEGFIIIQIDTDVSEQKGFDVFKHRGNKLKELSVNELVEKVKEKIINEKITTKIYEQHKDRIIFAIAVESIECWLLPLYFEKESDKSQVLNCFERLNKGLAKKNLKTISVNKDPFSYNDLSLPYTKSKTLQNCYTENPSLQIFVEEVKNKTIALT
jgi:hypothetical protein